MKRMRSPVPPLSKRKKRHSAFPLRLYDMLESAEELGYANVISWMPDGKSFKIHVDGTRDLGDEKAIVQALQRTFNITRYRSFLRQLQLYGFDRTYKGPNRGECRHELFVRGQRDLLLRKSVGDFQRGDGVGKSNSSPDASKCDSQPLSSDSLFLKNDNSNYWMPSCAFQSATQSSISQPQHMKEPVIPTALLNLLEHRYDTNRFDFRDDERYGNIVVDKEQNCGGYDENFHSIIDPRPIVKSYDWTAFETDILRTAL
mmetsp:Transcript_9551/g.28500  ORF Transcript_9551/g.28500 Transcript_9551/m.28500 type:complete len:258 (-) Transcript_9551:144-917(-)|eukprot:CAMPEP_0172369936 /NCGR_PEP_ID=MMETSP1060-20121228/35324_1 /TAXON_ID=37318 /ORGANISM="Pseudo-nitzschia pungens, Strain cf. cingulata" /LENGTH=257 /DNA_ID=CAMNT_0013095031 /DNA_START=42 /DNA_END=815 /DNA_ORIENTATION=+